MGYSEIANRQPLYTPIRNEDNRNAYLSGISFARVEGAIAIIARHVPRTAHHIINVLAKGGSIRSILARAQTEFIGSHEVLAQKYISECDMKLGYCIRTVHSWICCNWPNAEEKINPPMGLPKTGVSILGRV